MSSGFEITTVTSQPNLTTKGDAMFKMLETYKKLFGPLPNNPNYPENGSLSLENIEPNDILSLYFGRELVTPSSQITAAVLNNRNATFLDIVAPLVLTPEINFTTAFRSINLVEFPRVAEGAPFQTITAKTGLFKDTTTKKKLGITGAISVFTDPNFGADQFAFYLTGLAQCAKLTIMLETCYALVSLAYSNSTREITGKDVVDYSKVQNLAGDLFGIIPLNIDLFLSRIFEIRESKIVGLDTLIVPEKVLLFLDKINGNAQTVLQEVIFPINSTGVNSDIRIGRADTNIQSNKTIQGINIYELKSFVLNSDQTDNSYRSIQPLRTTVIISRFFPSQTNELCYKTFTECNNDIMIYCMTATSGEEVRISYREGLKYCFLFNHHDGNPSQHLINYVNQLNNELDIHHKQPENWRLIQEYYKGQTLDVNFDDMFDYDNPIPFSVEGKRTAAEQTGWRNQFGFVTFNPQQGNPGRYNVPRHLGDLNKSALPNKKIKKVAERLTHHFKLINGFDINNFISDLYEIYQIINNEEWTPVKIKALYDANVKRINYGNIVEVNYESQKEREQIFGKKEGVIDWPTNIYGGFDLPPDVDIYPGFATAGGLRTIATKTSEFGQRVSRLIKQGEIVVSYIREYIGNSNIIDKNYTPPWFSKVSSLETLFENILPKGYPIFFPIYEDITFIEVEQTGEKENILIYQSIENSVTKKFFENKDKDVISIQGLLDKEEIFDFEDMKEIRDYIEKGKDLVDILIPQNFWIFLIVGYDKFDLIAKMESSEANFTTFFTTILTNYLLYGNKKERPILNKKFFEKFDVEKSPELNRVLQVRKIIETFRKIDSLKEINDAILEVNRNSESVKNITLSSNDKKDYDIIHKTTNNRIISENNEQIQAAFKIEKPIKLNKYKEVLENLLKKYKKSESQTIKTEGEILKYIRTPLTGSPKFLDYYSNIKEGIKIVPANPETNYSTPIKSEIEKKEEVKSSGVSPKIESRYEATSFSYYGNNLNLSHFPIGEAFYFKKNSTTISSKLNKDVQEEELFSIDINKKPQKNYSEKMTSFFSKESISLSAPIERTAPPLNYRESKKISIDDKNLYFNQFPGPWDSNLNYYQNEISNDGTALFFLALIFSPFKIDVFSNIAKIGERLLNLSFVRNSEEHEMSSCIVMKAGSETLIIVFGRMLVIPSQDGISGDITISAEFHSGFVRRNPKNIDWLPYSMPYSFRGGQDSRFIKTIDQFFLSNANGRPSLLAVATPISETKYDYPLTMFNDSAYNAPNIENTSSIYRKISSADFLRFCFGTKKISHVSAKIKSIENYYQCHFLSFTMHLGCRRYANEKGEFDRITPGTGPKRFEEMNYGDAWLAWNGQGAFPRLTNQFKERF